MKNLLETIFKGLAITFGYALITYVSLYFCGICLTYPLVGIPVLMCMIIMLCVSLTKIGRELL